MAVFKTTSPGDIPSKVALVRRLVNFDAFGNLDLDDLSGSARVIVFVQSPQQGEVLGAVQRRLN